MVVVRGVVLRRSGTSRGWQEGEGVCSLFVGEKSRVLVSVETCRDGGSVLWEPSRYAGPRGAFVAVPGIPATRCGWPPSLAAIKVGDGGILRVLCHHIHAVLPGWLLIGGQLLWLDIHE